MEPQTYVPSPPGWRRARAHAGRGWRRETRERALSGGGAVKAGGCDIPYTVTKLDPESMVAEKILEGRGAASAALEVGDEIWVGVFVGDAIERRTRTE